MKDKKKIKTEKALDILVPFILRGGGARDAYSELASEGYECSKSYSYDLFKMASEHIKDTFHKSWENDYEYIKAQYQRLLTEAMYEHDRATQRQCLRDLMKLMGLEEKTITHKFETTEESLEAFNKMFE